MSERNDYYAFKNTSAGSNTRGNGCLIGILAVFAVLGCLWLVGNLFV